MTLVDARCMLHPNWLERLEQGVANGFAAAIAPDMRGPAGQTIPGWDVLGAGPWAIAGAPPTLEGGSSVAVLYRQPREVSAIAPRVALIRRQAAITSGALADIANAGRFALTHLALAFSDAGFDCLSRPFVAGDFLGTVEVGPATRSDAGMLAIPSDVTWMRERWGPRLEDDARFHPELRLRGERLDCAPRFPPRAAVAAAPARICAFPFDRWGSGELRVRQPMAALERAGRAHVLLMPEHDTGRAPNVLELARMDPDVLYLHNFFHDYQLLALEDYAKRSHALRVLGMDDLLTELPPENPFAATIYSDIAARIARAVERCDRLIVSTEPLAEAYGRGKDVRVVPNAIDLERWQGLANVPRGGAKPRVGWAGARQHLGDLRLLEPVVAATWREIDWVFFGMCPHALRPMAAEIHDMVPVDEYPTRLASLGLDLAVAPLQDNAFNRSKSHLKLLEYGVLGLPVVASRVDPYRAAPALLVGADPDEWIEAVRGVARDRAQARAVGSTLRQWVLDSWTLRATLESWIRALSPGR